LQLISNDRDTETIVYTSPEFQPCAESFSEKYAFVGPLVIPPESSFRKKGKKLIYVSMGTVNNDMLELYSNCIKAFGNTETELLISAGESVDISSLGPLPENVRVERWVEQTAVLKEADVFLSHCGMNSASESLYFGVPVLGFPQTSEQGAVAFRIKQLGAGRLLDSNSVEDIERETKLLMDDPSYRKNAEGIGASFRRCGGAAAAADKIELLVSNKFT